MAHADPVSMYMVSDASVPSKRQTQASLATLVYQGELYYGEEGGAGQLPQMPN